MTIAVDQDRLAREVLGYDNKALATTQHQRDIEQAALDAEQKVGRFTAFFWPSGDPPAYWHDWAQSEAALRLAIGHRREHLPVFRAAVDSAREDAWNSVTTLDPGANFSAGTISVNSLRRFVVVACAKMQRRAFPDFGIVDLAIQETLTELWNRSGWQLRRRVAEITLPADVMGAGAASVTISGSIELDRIETMALYYKSTNPPPTSEYPPPTDQLLYVSPDELAARIARSPSATGRPAVFRLEQFGSSTVWKVWPNTDQAYTLVAELSVKQPTLPTDPSSTSAFDQYPEEWRPYIRQMSLAKTLRMLGHPAFPEQERSALNMLPTLHNADDRGRIDNRGMVADVYRDIAAMGDGNMLGGYMG